jgi:hypothetical protein
MPGKSGKSKAGGRQISEYVFYSRRFTNFIRCSGFRYGKNIPNAPDRCPSSYSLERL